MKDRFLTCSDKPATEANIYANKSALILDWLLKIGLEKDSFSLRDVVKETGVSIGLVQRTFKTLILKGFLQSKGVRTSKQFSFNKPSLLLKSWLTHYDLKKKCKIRTYQSGFQDKEELLSALKKSKLKQDVALALHSAAEAYGMKNSNLDTLELYLLDSEIRLELEDLLQLEPQERGYEVLLLEPYYNSLLNFSTITDDNLKLSPTLLTFLDLYHFPLRGQEQAEFMIERIPELKRIYEGS